jgi:hypothetical protein
VEVLALEQGGNLSEVEHTEKHTNVILGRRDDLNLERMTCYIKLVDGTTGIDIDGRKLSHLQFTDDLTLNSAIHIYQRLLVDTLSNTLSGCSTVFTVEPTFEKMQRTNFTPKSALRPPGL